MESDDTDRPRPGRPRSEEAHTAILRASLELIREVGFDALAMDAIAARAGVGKATVYRRWKNKELLVVEAIDAIVRAVPDPDTGSTEGDLRVLMNATLRMYADPATAALLSGLVAAMVRSEPIARAVRGGFVGMRREAMRRALERGIARGELRAETDLELALDLLSGPMLWRYLIGGQSVDEGLARGSVDAVMRAFGPAESSHETGGHGR
ncbi:MAG TPA: TetR/AcrR family transcriptional regulator [Longimicrobium sp.]|nr:TetR/AcrR family transcriptional regulator [Longimicrobium sp.]